MKLKLSLAAAFVAVLTLAACGGNAMPPVSVGSPDTLTIINTVDGSGATAASGHKVQVNYTGWLYSASAPGYKGAKFDESAAGKPFAFTIGAVNTKDSVIPGFGMGVQGMKVGGKRTILVPSSLAYGSSGYGSIPPNAGVVFDVELVAICANSSCA